MCYVLFCGSPDIIDALITHCAPVNAVTAHGSTGHTETMEMVTEAGLDAKHVLGPYIHRGPLGKTAIDRLHEHADYDDELGAAFQRLLESILKNSRAKDGESATTQTPQRCG